MSFLESVLGSFLESVLESFLDIKSTKKMTQFRVAFFLNESDLIQSKLLLNSRSLFNHSFLFQFHEIPLVSMTLAIGSTVLRTRPNFVVHLKCFLFAAMFMDEKPPTFELCAQPLIRIHPRKFCSMNLQFQLLVFLNFDFHRAF